MIPELDERGSLPPGIYRATWTEIVTRYATSTHRRDRGELFPADWPTQPDGTTFRDLFQRDHITGRPKGIVAIDLAGLP
jgi:hypothetical protein